MSIDLDAIEARVADVPDRAAVCASFTKMMSDGYTSLIYTDTICTMADLAALVAEVRALLAVAEAAEQVAGAYANPWASEDDRLTAVDALAPALDAWRAGGGE